MNIDDILKEAEFAPVYYRCEWPQSGGDNEDYVSDLLVDRTDTDGEKDYQVAVEHKFVLEPLLTLAQARALAERCVREQREVEDKNA